MRQHAARTANIAWPGQGVAGRQQLGLAKVGRAGGNRVAASPRTFRRVALRGAPTIVFGIPTGAALPAGAVERAVRLGSAQAGELVLQRLLRGAWQRAASAQNGQGIGMHRPRRPSKLQGRYVRRTASQGHPDELAATRDGALRRPLIAQCQQHRHRQLRNTFSRADASGTRVPRREHPSTSIPSSRFFMGRLFVSISDRSGAWTSGPPLPPSPPLPPAFPPPPLLPLPSPLPHTHSCRVLMPDALLTSFVSSPLLVWAGARLASSVTSPLQLRVLMFGGRLASFVAFSLLAQLSVLMHGAHPSSVSSPLLAMPLASSVASPLLVQLRVLMP